MTKENEKLIGQIERQLALLDFNRDPKVKDLIADWARYKHYVYINGVPLGKLLENIDVEEALHGKNDEIPKFIETTKAILSSLIPPKIQKQVNLDDLAGLIHQGGILFRLEKEVFRVLTEQGRAMDSVKINMKRDVYITTNEKGFSVHEDFRYSGNISKRDPDNPEFRQDKNVVPMLSGNCYHDVTFNSDDGRVEVNFKKMELVSPEAELVRFLRGGEQQVRASRDFKDRYEKLIVEYFPPSDPSAPSDTEQDSPSSSPY